MKRFVILIAAVLVCNLAFGQQKRWAVVELSSIYMRIAPDYESALETQELMGTVVEITDKKGYIIGSSDKKRLGTFHPASIEVLKRKQIVCYNTNDELLELKGEYNMLYHAQFGR